MNRTIAIVAFGLLVTSAAPAQTLQEQNKERARDFYNDLWFSDNTDVYKDYVADEYIINDIGDDKGIMEKAIVQKQVADFFWDNGNMEGSIDFQLAEDDIVATRWQWKYEPSTLLGRFVFGTTHIPIINVFRFKDGKIVEIWNHRHDIDVPGRRRFLVIQGLLIGLLIGLVPLIWALRLRKKLKRLSPS